MAEVTDKLRFDKELDLSGLSCPLPIVMTSEAVKKLEEGKVLRVVSTDPGFERDIWNWSNQTKNRLLNLQKEGDKIVAYIEKQSEGKEPSLWYWIKFHSLGVKLHARLVFMYLNPFSEKPDHFITFVAISEGTRAEKHLKEANEKAKLLPIPDEIDPRCGVVLGVKGFEKAKEIYQHLLGENYGVEAIYRKKGNRYEKVYP